MDTRNTEGKIDNDIYNELGDTWWESDSPFVLLSCAINPVRVGYFKRKLLGDMNIDPSGKTALEVGCGGGILSEEISKLGFSVTGIDPSENSLVKAAEHAMAGGLDIKYIKANGEALPLNDNAYDVVFCCDVLEHVDEPRKVIEEIYRVLKPGGVFCYDTLNRTFYSKLVAIKISQEWKRWAYAPPDLHKWSMFIKPDEMISMLINSNMHWREHMGMGLDTSLCKFLSLLRRRAKGELTYRELGNMVTLSEDKSLGIMYMGYAVKNIVRD